MCSAAPNCSPRSARPAVPDEVLALAREAMSEDPYLAAWRTRRAATSTVLDPDRSAARFRAEARGVTHAYYAADDARLNSYVQASLTSAAARQKATEALVRLSLSDRRVGAPRGRDHVGPAVAPDVL